MVPSSASAGPPGRVLVTDGEFKHTLGIVRQLARRGHEVHLLASSSAAPAVHSRAVRRWHRAPASGAPDYDARLLEVAGELAPVSLLPVGSGAVANDKQRTAELARTLGLRTPRERKIASLEEARAAWRARWAQRGDAEQRCC